MGTAGTKTPRAVTKRLERLARKVEDELIENILAVLRVRHRDEVVDLLASGVASKKTRDSVSPNNAEVYECVVAAFREVVLRFPG